MYKRTMKALCFNPSLPRAIFAKALSLFSKDAYWSRGSPLIYTEAPVPELPGPEWVRIKTRLTGVCGSDMAAITLKGSLDNPIKHFISFPMFLGHEIVGEIESVGDAVKDLPTGERVVVYVILSCVPRGISPPCPNCQNGDFGLCQNLAEGGLPPGQCIGTNNRTGGGFSEFLVAHRSQVFPIPDSIPDEHAVLVDPLGVALHAVLRAQVLSSHKVLVIGAGIVGLSVIQMIRALGIDCKVYVVARHGFQKELAVQCGADQIIEDTEDATKSIHLAEDLQAKQYASRFVKPFFMGGFDRTFDCVGTAETLQRSICWANHRGRVMLVGASPSKRFEWSLLYWKEVELVGCMSFGMETVQGKRRHTVEIVFEMAEEERLRLDLLPLQTFQLADYRMAFRSLLGKSRGRTVKAAFDFRAPGKESIV